MKRLFTLIALFAVMLGAVAQTENVYLWKNGVYTAHPLSSIDSITFAVPGNPNDKPNDVPNDVTAVDLGLPSGTLWADRNVGADSPEDYGDHFAWGETEPKTTYDWSTYKWCNGAFDNLTKYCTNEDYGYNGYADNKITLEPSDDAATANYREKWSMPTRAQIDELRSYCTWTWGKQKDTWGYNITGINGNSIFLPATGYCYPNSLNGVDQEGNYWTCSLFKDYPDIAYNLNFTKNEHCVENSDRLKGYSVRAVLDCDDINSRPLNDNVVDYTNGNTKNCVMNPVPSGVTIYTDDSGKVWNLDYLHLIPSTELVNPQVTIKIFGTQSGTYNLKIVTLSPRFLVQGDVDAETYDKLYRFRVNLFQKTEEGGMPTKGTPLYVPGTTTRNFESHPLTELATPCDTIDICPITLDCDYDITEAGVMVQIATNVSSSLLENGYSREMLLHKILLVPHVEDEEEETDE